MKAFDWLQLSAWALLAWCLLEGLCGCAPSLAESRYAGKAERRTLGAKAEAPTQRCIDLDSKRTNYSAIAKVTAVLAGASGVSTLPIGDDDTAHERAQIAVAGLGVGFAALSAGAVVIADGATAAWVRECSE